MDMDQKMKVFLEWYEQRFDCLSLSLCLTVKKILAILIISWLIIFRRDL